MPLALTLDIYQPGQVHFFYRLSEKNVNYEDVGHFISQKSSSEYRKRDLFDLYESYKYMNSELYDPLLFDGRWDFGTGWLELHLSLEEWHPKTHSHEAADH